MLKTITNAAVTAALALSATPALAQHHNKHDKKPDQTLTTPPASDAMPGGTTTDQTMSEPEATPPVETTTTDTTDDMGTEPATSADDAARQPMPTPSASSTPQ